MAEPQDASEVRIEGLGFRDPETHATKSLKHTPPPEPHRPSTHAQSHNFSLNPEFRVPGLGFIGVQGLGNPKS